MKKNIGILTVILCMLLLAGCGSKISETTMFYSMVTSPSDYYIRLEEDGSFVNNAGLNGTYKIDGDKVTFHDVVGGDTIGYLVDDKYLFYFAYDGNENTIPDGDTFDAAVYDGSRTTLTFNEDGTMEMYIYQENIYNFQLLGTYERQGNLITCTFPSKSGGISTNTYGVYQGILYEVFSSDMEDFTEAQVASISQLGIAPAEEISVLAVVMIVAALLAIFVIIFYLLYALRKTKNSNTNTEKSRKKK